jgi:hypothetical protein
MVPPTGFESKRNAKCPKEKVLRFFYKTGEVVPVG